MIYNLANLVVADAASTPVNHTFVPLPATPTGVTRWRERAASGLAIADKFITYSVKEPTSGGKNVKQRIMLEVPKVDTTNASLPVLVDTARVVCDIVTPETWNDQEVKDLLAQFQNLLSRAAIDKLGDNIVGRVQPY